MIIIAVSSLVILTSLIFVYAEHTETSVGTAVTPEEFTNIIETSTGVYTANYVIELPALSASQEYIFDGTENTSSQTFEISGTNLQPYLFQIDDGNAGKYVFKNMTIDVDEVTGISIGTGTGSVSFENVDFTGGSCYSMIESNCSNLKIDSCSFNGSYITYVTVYDGSLTIANSWFRGDSYWGVEAYTSGKILIDNCYFQNAISAITFSPDSNADLTISNCTFLAPAGDVYDTSLVEIYPGGYSTGNSIKLTNSLFEGSGYNCQAIDLFGNSTGTMAIEDCYFFDLESDNSIVSLDSSMSFSITGTTFYSNMTSYGLPVLQIAGMDGQIINSTFLNNYIYADVPTGCVSITDSQKVDLIYDTFWENQYEIPGDPPIWGGASLQIGDGVTVDLINSIMDPQDDGSTSSILNQGGTIVNKGSIDVVSDNTLIVALPESGNNGLMAGCDLSEYFDITDTTQEEIWTTMIIPYGLADGNGVAQSGLPQTDQRGVARQGKIDIGSVTVKSALFDANNAKGGYWEDIGYYGYSEYEPYQFLKEIIYGQYEQLAVPALNPENTILLPSDKGPYNIDGLRFLGWSTNSSAALPDSNFVNPLHGTMSGEFAIDTTYYAIWGENFAVEFVPGNGLTPVVKAWADNGSEVPSYGTVNNKTLTGWTYDPAGTVAWDPTTPLDGNITVYGQWTAAQSLTVKFVNGDQTNTVSVPPGNSVPKPSDPVRQGFVFSGWFTAADGGTEWNFATSITNNLTLYAQWEPATYFTVTFDPHNGGAMFTAKVEGGQKVSPPQTPELRDNVFGGWFTSPEGGTKWNFDSPVTGDMTLYAHWSTDSGGGGGGFDNKDSLSVVAVIVASIFASLGIIPLALGGIIAPQGSIANLFQHGTDNVSTDNTGEDIIVTFDPENGRSSWTATVGMGRLLGIPGNPGAPSGMKFSHWSESPNGPPFNFMTPIRKVTHLFAVYK